tara:strand:- start:12801 stop:13388 length:588 start_codon:yes stop_codon:yes gene_type:complete
MTDQPTIIVSGLPRSGTSMMMQMLAATNIEPLTDHQRTPDPDNPKGYYEHEAIKALARDPSPLLNASGKAAKVIHRLLAYLPDGPTYAIVFLHRDINQVLASQSAMLERLNRTGAKLDTARLAVLYQNEVAAALTNAGARPNTHLLELTHADVLADPTNAATQLTEFFATLPNWPRPLDPAAMAKAVDPELHRQR